MRSVRSARHLKKMVAELCFYWALHRVQVCAEHHFVEFLHHLTRSEIAKIAARHARRALGMFLRDLGKIYSAFDLRLQIQARSLVRNQNVSCACACQNRSFL